MITNPFQSTNTYQFGFLTLIRRYWKIGIHLQIGICLYRNASFISVFAFWSASLLRALPLVTDSIMFLNIPADTAGFGSINPRAMKAESYITAPKASVGFAVRRPL